MASGSLFVGLLLVAGAVAQSFIQTGKEYEYKVDARVGAGTYDYVPHASGIVYTFTARLQAESDTSIKGEISNVKHSEYVGRKSDDYDLKFDSDDAKVPFGITLEKGLFKSLALPENLPLEKQNTIKAFASTFQLNGEHLKAGEKAFKAPEETIHGTCDVSYVFTSDTIVKSINVAKDCKDRPVRRLDDIRGYDCEWEDKDKADGLVTLANTIYTFEKEGSGHKITKIIKNGAFVSQMYEAEGVSHIAMANITMTLVNAKNNPGGIQAGSQMTNTLRFEFADGNYKWNADRDLKASEPALASTSDFIGDDQNSLKATFMKILKQQKAILTSHDTSKERIKMAHSQGIESLRLPMLTMNYDSLMSIFNELHGDKSEDGIMLCNIFTELLGSTGSSASAMVALDLVKQKKFDNQRDAARVLTSIPFHIRRPSKKLVAEFESILGTDQESVVEMAIPLTFGHLVRMTCERAGQPFSEEQKACFKELGAKWVNDFYGKFKAATSRNTRNIFLSAIGNIRYGGLTKVLKPVIYGEEEGFSAEERSTAIYAAAWEVGVRKMFTKYYLPVFAERKNHHMVRMSALHLILKAKPTMTDFSRVLGVLKTETDYEVINFAFTFLESLASSISPCERKTSEMAAFFLKYLKQFSKYEADWGFGVSKIYTRQFNQRKYGYGGSYTFHTVGSHSSTTPLVVGMGMGSYIHHNYQSEVLYVQFMIEGVAKGIIKKFKTMDLGTWKTADLKGILDGMNIKEREDQPVRAKIMVVFKGTVVISRSYDDSDTSEGGKMSNLFDKLKALGSAYSINHQRVVRAFELSVEQPTEAGIPALYMSSMTALMSLKASVKRGSQRGLMFREVEYHLDNFAQARSLMSVILPRSKKIYAVAQDRIYNVHVPRKVVIGVNPIKKEVKLRVSRPEYDHPAMFMMHSRTQVVCASTNIWEKDDSHLKKHCPSCESRVEVSAGEEAAVSRTIIDRESERRGYRVNAEYFDCEMNVARSNTFKSLLAAFMPYNKSPRTAWTSIMMGLRQIRGYMIYFPRAEKCGLVAQYSQSKVNPVREIELSVEVSSNSKGEKLFFKGRKTLIKATLKAKGDKTRGYRMTLQVESTPGNLMNKIKMKLDRAAVASLDIKPYVICMGYENKYPPFGREMFNIEMDKPLKMTGKALLQYGEGTSCSGGQGEITANLDYSTTQEARESLKKKYYYQECMKLKATDAWKGRDALPLSRSCMLTAFDAATARRYKYDIKFTKMTDRMKAIVSSIRGMIQAVMLQFFDMESTNTDISPFLKIDATFKESDKLVDIVYETSRGTKKVEDYALKLNWADRLRNLKLSKMPLKLNKMGLIKPCITTSTYVQTMDNVTYNIGAPSCWTLVSGHCSPNPSYAVFTKKGSGKPLMAKVYIGGYAIDFDGATVTVDGNNVDVTDDAEYKHKVANVEIFKITKWGTVFNVYSSLKVWISYDGNFISVTPAPSVTGQHCGLCGNYNRNKYDETTGKDSETLVGFEKMADEWKWKC